MSEKEFREKVIALQRRMYGLALRAGLPPDDAADAVQETQLRLWRGREGIPDTDSSLTAYCMTAMRNECVSLLRKKRDLTRLDTVVAEKVSESGMETVETSDTKRHLENLIDSLPRGQRTVVRMSIFAGFDVNEIVEATGFTPGNVRQLLSRGRKRIRELIDFL